MPNMRRLNTHTFIMTLLAIVMLTAIVPALARIDNDDIPENDSTMKLTADTLPYDDARRYDEFFIEAVCQKLKGNADSALTLLKHCIALDSTAAEAYFACAPFYKQQGNDSLALQCLLTAARLRPDNNTYQEYVARQYIGAADYERAITAYENLYSHHRDRSDVLNILLQLYNQKKDYRNMLRTLDRMEQIDGSSEELTLMKMNVYEQRGDRKMAYQMLKQVVDSHPEEANYKAMLGNWLLNHDRRDEAFSVLQDALRDDNDNEFAQMSLYDYYRAAGNDSAADTMRDHLLLSTKTSDNTKMSMMQQYIKENEKQGGDSVPVLSLFGRVMKANPKNADIAYLRAAYMELKEMPYDSVAAAYRQVLQIEPERESARLGLIRREFDANNLDEVIRLSTEGTQYNPSNIFFYYFLGLAHFKNDNPQAALDAMKRGESEACTETDSKLVADFYSLMGDILYSMNRTDEAFAAYDICLQKDADNMMTLNNYAYYLSMQQRDLDKAEKMSHKTIEEEPTNPTYLDTYAWILFLKERYPEAKAYIDRALECSGYAPNADTDTLTELDTASISFADTALTDSIDADISGVVLEHAGDIYARCGDIDCAVELWRQASQYSDGSAMLPKKIKQRKYIPAK